MATRMWDRRVNRCLTPEELVRLFPDSEEKFLAQLEHMCRQFEERFPHRCVGMNVTFYASREGWNHTRRIQKTDEAEYQRLMLSGRRHSIYWAGQGWRHSGAAPRNHARDSKR